MSALPLANGLMSPNASARSTGSVISLNKVIFDDRYAEARSFGKAFGPLGISVEPLNNGDVTDIWLREREVLRQGRPSAIAGTTQFGPMFVFEQLGREHRMRIALRVEHQALDDGNIAHIMTCPPETLALAEEMRAQNSAWPDMMAALVTHCSVAGSAPADHTFIMPGSKPRLVQRSPSRSDAEQQESVIHYYTPQGIQEGHPVAWDGSLFSWVIAPIEQVTGRSA
jgi:hypothetical protein